MRVSVMELGRFTERGARGHARIQSFSHNSRLGVVAQTGNRKAPAKAEAFLDTIGGI
jgi:hypothetical protein